MWRVHETVVEVREKFYWPGRRNAVENSFRCCQLSLKIKHSIEDDMPLGSLVKNESSNEFAESLGNIITYLFNINERVVLKSRFLWSAKEHWYNIY